MTNRLGAETSPYLRQHKDNPVDWFAWGADAFAEAQRRNVPMLLSVGYSACHWCHVMAHECFEDAETAHTMNRLFVNVKVDREERPDVDAVYMDAVQAIMAEYPAARMVALQENYRSTQPILDVTNTLISRAEERYTKNLYTRRVGGERPWLVTAHDEQAQTRFVVDRVLELHEDGVPLRDMAVLFRAGYMSADLEIELTARKIPFEKWGGLKFLEAAHVKDVLAFLRILENPRDEVSWYRLLLLLPGIGEATARGAIARMAELAWTSDAFGRYVPPPRARAAHESLVQLLDQLRAAPSDRKDAVSADIARVRRLYDDILRDRMMQPAFRPLQRCHQPVVHRCKTPERSGRVDGMRLNIGPSPQSQLHPAAHLASETVW